MVDNERIRECTQVDRVSRVTTQTGRVRYSSYGPHEYSPFAGALEFQNANENSIRKQNNINQSYCFALSSGQVEIYQVP